MRWHARFATVGTGAAVVLAAAGAMSFYACSSSKNTATPAPLGDDVSDVAAGSDAATGLGVRPPADAAGSAGDAGDDDAAETADPFAAVCGSLVFTGGARVAIATPHFASFGGITPVPLSFVWVDTTGAVYVDDRGQLTEPFATSLVQAADAGSSASSMRSAIDVLGTSVYLFAPDAKSLVVYQRPLPGNPFDGGSTATLTRLNAQIASMGSIAELAIGGYANTMMLLVQNGSSFTLLESTLGQGGTTWPAGSVHDEAALVSSGPKARRVPTGLSYDARVLFYYDEGTSREMAASRASASGSFTTFQPVGTATGMYKGAAPDESCDGIFYVGTDSAGAGVFTTIAAMSADDAGN